MWDMICLWLMLMFLLMFELSPSWQYLLASHNHSFVLDVYCLQEIKKICVSVFFFFSLDIL